MKLLFTIDTKDYDKNGTTCIRPSVRGIIIRENRLAMIHSLQYDFYKFPGGGMETGESQPDTLIREVREESGLCIIPTTICPFGYVHRIQKGNPEDVFIQDNYYYLCAAEQEVVPQALDDYEDEERFALEWVFPSQVLYTNRYKNHGLKQGNFRLDTMLERECRVVELLIAEKVIADQ